MQKEKILVNWSFNNPPLLEDKKTSQRWVYCEQNVTTEKYEEYDGERWVIFND